MEKRVALESRGRDPSKVKELNLDNCRSTAVVGLTDQYTNLEILSMNNVGLTTLKGFPTLPMLKKLELSDNRISSGLNFLSGCKKLTHLNLSGNKISELEVLKPLSGFENLKNLDLFNNEVTSIEDYRSKVFALHPALKYLDGFDKVDREAEDSDEEDEMNGNDSDDGSEVVEEESEDDEADDGNLSLSCIYNDNLEEVSSAGSLYDGSDAEEEEDLDEEDGDGDDDADGDQNSKAQGGDENADGAPEESTRGKKRKHEDDDDDN